MIEKLYCVNLSTSKLEEMIDFYHGILGIPMNGMAFIDKGTYVCYSDITL